jgi:hypothetical protein
MALTIAIEMEKKRGDQVGDRRCRTLALSFFIIRLKMKYPSVVVLALRISNSIMPLLLWSKLRDVSIST